MNQKANAKREFPYVKLILIVTLVLVVAIVGYSIVDTLGVVAHFNTAATSDNYKLNENIVDVYRYITASDSVLNNAQTFYMYYLYYGASASSMIGESLAGPFQIFSSYISAGYDYVSAAYATMEICVREGAFDLAAYTYTRNILTYCEGADRDDTYTEDTARIERDVERYMDDLENMVEKDMGMSMSSFLSRYMGDGVSKRDLRKALSLQYKAREYANVLNERYLDSVTQEEIDKYVADNKSAFYTSKYYSFTLLDEAMMTAVNKCTTVDEVKTTIADTYFKKNYDTQYKKYITDAKITDENAEKTKADILTTILSMAKIGDNKAVFFSSDKDTYKKACYDIAKAIYDTTKLASFCNGTAASTAYADPAGKSATDLQKWLFDSARKDGDFKAIKNSSTNSSTGAVTTTYTFYMADDLMILDEAKTRDAYFVKLTDDEKDVKDGLTAAEKAEKMLAELKGITDKEEFADAYELLVEKYAPASSYTTYAEQQMLSYDSLKSTSTDLADWIFNTLRKEGDMAILPLAKEDKEKEDAAQEEADKKNETEADTEAVTDPETDADTETETEAKTEASTSAPTTSDKKDTSRYFVYYVEENDKTWIENGRTGVAGEKLNDWFEAHVTEYHVEIDGEYDTSAYTEAATEAKSEAATTAPTDKKDETAA